MAKSKVAAGKTRDAQVKAISSVKGGAITKPSQTPKSKSKEIAKQAAAKVDIGDKKSKKTKKEPTPESSASESDSDEAVTSASSASSDEESESEAETSKPAVKSSGTKLNGTVKATVKADAESSDSSDASNASDASDASDTSDDEEDAKPVKKSVPAVTKIDAAQNSSDSEENSDVSSDESDSESDHDAIAVPAAADSKALNGALKVSSEQPSSAGDSDSSDSSDSASESDESEEATVATKKRKADTDAVPAAKKFKTEATGDDGGQKNLFVGQLSWNVDEDWLTREFERFGELSGVRVITDKSTGRSKGFGYVEFVNSADAAKAKQDLHGTSIDNRTINVDFSAPRPDSGAGGAGGYKERSKSYGDQKSPPSDTLFVANIAFEATEDIIGEEFGKHGTVLGVRLPTNIEDGNPKGFGYVQFASVDEASEALNQLAGSSICGRPIRLDFSTPRANTGDSPRGGRGGRGGGGYDRGGRGGGGYDRGGRGGGRGRGGFDRGGRGGDRGGRGGGRGSSTNRGGFNDFKGKKMTF